MSKAGKRCDIPMSVSYIKKLISTRIYRVVETIVSDNTKIESEPRYLTEEQYIKEYKNVKILNLEVEGDDVNHKEIQIKKIKYNEAMWRLSLLFFKLITADHVTIELPLCEIQAFAKVSNVRNVLENMERMGLITISEVYSTGRLRITVRNFSRTDMNNSDFSKVAEETKLVRKLNQFEYLPTFYTSDEFLKEELGVQKLMLFLLIHKFEYKKEKSKAFNKKKLMNELGISNLSRMEEYFNKAKEILEIDCERKRTESYLLHRQRVDITYVVSLGNFHAEDEPTEIIEKGNDTPEEVSTEDKEMLKKEFRISYMKYILTKQCDYQYDSVDEDNLWLNLLSNYGQIGFSNTADEVVYTEYIASMTAYFAGILEAKRHNEHTS